MTTLPERSVMIEGLHAGIDVITILRERAGALPQAQLDRLLKVWPQEVNLKEGRCTLDDAYSLSSAITALEAKAELAFPDLDNDVTEDTKAALINAASVLSGEGYDAWVDLCSPLPGTQFHYDKPEQIDNERHAHIALILSRVIEPHWREVLQARQVEVEASIEVVQETKATRAPRKPRGRGKASAAQQAESTVETESVAADANVEVHESPTITLSEEQLHRLASLIADAMRGD